MKKWILPLAVTPCTLAQAADAAAAPAGGAGAVVQMLGALGLVLAALFGLLWLLRRVSGGRLAGAAPIRTVGGIALGSRERVVVLEIGEHWLVVGVAPGSVTGIATLPRGEFTNVDESANPATPDFGSLLARLKAGRP